MVPGVARNGQFGAAAFRQSRSANSTPRPCRFTGFLCQARCRREPNALLARMCRALWRFFARTWLGRGRRRSGVIEVDADLPAARSFNAAPPLRPPRAAPAGPAAALEE